MTAALSCDDAEISLGALVLGALEPAEREQVEAHVHDCPRCAAALAEIAPLPGLLNRAGLSAAELAPAPQHILDNALGRVRAEQPAPTSAYVAPPTGASVEPAPAVSSVVPLRRRRLPMLLAAAAAGVLALVLGGSWWVSSHQTPASVTAIGSSAATGVKAKVVMIPTDEGTTLDLTLSGVTPGEKCSLIAVGTDGSTEVTSTWVANYEGEATITGSTWLSVADISRFDITTPDGTTLLQVDVPA